MIPQRVRSHEQPDMAAWYGLLNDTILGGPDIFRSSKDLFRRRDVVFCARQQIGGTSDIVQIELPTEADEFAPGKAVLLEDLADHLEIGASVANARAARKARKIPMSCCQRMGTLTETNRSLGLIRIRLTLSWLSPQSSVVD
jgi:hypothetical protein